MSEQDMIENIVRDSIVSDIKDAKSGIDALQHKVHAGDLKIVSFEGKLDNLSEKFDDLSTDVKYLIKLIKDGNGQPSIMNRLLVLENSKTSTEEFIKEQKESKKESSHGLFSVKAAVAAGSLSLLGTIITVIATLMK